AVLVALGWSLLAAGDRSRRMGPEERLMVLGAGVLVAGAAPCVAVGFPIATAGIFDRANIFADVGTAMIYAGALGLAWRTRRALLPYAVVLLAVGGLAVGNVDDVRNFHAAAADGRQLLHAVD